MSTNRHIVRGRPRSLGFNIIWALKQENLTLLLANNKGADQPAHTRSLTSTFVICYLKSEITRSDSAKFSFFGGLQHDKMFGYALDQNLVCCLVSFALASKLTWLIVFMIWSR